MAARRGPVRTVAVTTATNRSRVRELRSLDVVKQSDYVVDLGPEGGSGGGQIIATGTPETVAKTKGSFTGQFLAPMLKKKSSRKAA